MRLSIANAKEYVAGYYAGLDRLCDFEIEGAGIYREGDFEVCRLNVVICDEADDFEPQAIQWDVFEEDEGDGRVRLRGEF